MGQGFGDGLVEEVERVLPAGVISRTRIEIDLGSICRLTGCLEYLVAHAAAYESICNFELGVGHPEAGITMRALGLHDRSAYRVCEASAFAGPVFLEQCREWSCSSYAF